VNSASRLEGDATVTLWDRLVTGYQELTSEHQRVGETTANQRHRTACRQHSHTHTHTHTHTERPASLGPYNQCQSHSSRYARSMWWGADGSAWFTTRLSSVRRTAHRFRRRWRQNCEKPNDTTKQLLNPRIRTGIARKLFDGNALRRQFEIVSH